MRGDSFMRACAWSLAAVVLTGSAVPVAADDLSSFPAVILPPDVVSLGCVEGGSGYGCTLDLGLGAALYATVTNGREADDTAPSDLSATLAGNGTLPGQYYGFVFSTFGVTGADNFAVDPEGTSPPAYAAGGSVTIVNAGDLSLESMIASDIYFEPPAGQYDSSPGYLAYGAGAIVGLSIGAEGFADHSKNVADPNFDGGAGGAVTISNSGVVSVVGSGGSIDFGSTEIPVALNAVGAYSIGGDGWGETTSDTRHGGDGGAGGAITVTNTGSISANGGSWTGSTNGIFALSQGGVGNVSEAETDIASFGGDGGDVTITNAGSITGTGATVTGIYAVSTGGNSNDHLRPLGGDNDKTSIAGDGGTVEVILEAGSDVTITADDTAIGVMAISAGGYANTWDNGSGGDVTVRVEQGATLTTSGDTLSVGILAVSSGSIGEVAPADTQAVSTAFPGPPGAVTVENDGTIETTGSMAIGIAASSIGGAAIVTNGDASAASVLGNAADGDYAFDGGGVVLDNGGTVTTLGLAAHGLLAQSVGGGGGLFNIIESDAAAVAIGSQTSSNVDGGDGAAVTLTNSGSVTTGDGEGTGDAAIGIVAQSIGGGGGSSAGRAMFLGGLDADGNGGGDGGTVGVTTTGASKVTTKDFAALGILAQSVGGGGGNGSNAWGAVAAVGGAGGNGGDGAAVTVMLKDTGGVVTQGIYAAGVLAQSLGGGGGNGGYADSFGSLGSTAIGGRGGSGGDGGTVSIDNATTVSTGGDQAWGIVAQSLGGGGGTGGAAAAYSAGVITIGLALGGAGGDGGDADAVSVTNTGTILTGYADGSTYAYTGAGAATDGADAHGILAQSIGGGGGSGGSASARSLGIPTTEVPTITFDFASGGSGGSGGDGGEITIANSGTVKTAGDGAHGVSAQSIGGGGGNGGDSTAASYSLQGGIGDINLAVALGGTGGGGGSGGDVTVTNGTASVQNASGVSTPCLSDCDGTIETYGDNAIGVLAQSIGGGGGTGGTGNASTSSASLGNLLSEGEGMSASIATAVGGSGGDGNVGGRVVVTNLAGSRIRTYGASSYGIYAQSVGGGGGAAGSSATGTGTGTIKVDVSVGGDGGSGNDGGEVAVTNAGTIVTGGYTTLEDGTVVTAGGDAVGIFAQSIGGGGGSGGGTDPATTFGFDGQLITTVKSLVDKGLAQSSSLSISYAATVDVGGKGGAGGAGGDVTVANTGTITTYGQRSYGIEAQSIGGGGGNGSSATATTPSTWETINSDFEAYGSKLLAKTTGQFSISLAASVSVGGVAGSGSTGGTVTVENAGSITTAGYAAHAILAQSIGGGGGVGGDGTSSTSATLSLGVGYSASGGAGNSGGSVIVDDAGEITAVGDDAYGILAQSIGGGGGVAGAGCTNSSPQYASLGVEASQCLSSSISGTSESASALTDTLVIGIDFKGSAGANGDGNTVEIDKSAGAIVAGGARAMGIVAQSIGGGGGLAVGEATSISSVTFESTLMSGAGGDIAVDLGADATVTTYGDGGWGIFAQSIGAGGGFFGDSSLGLSFLNVNTLSLATGVAPVMGGDITLDLAGDIATYGANAHGVVVQTSGAGNSGGVGAGDTTVLGADLGSTQGVSYGVGGAISLTQTGGTISTAGLNAIGIVAQSIGTVETQSRIALTIAGTVEGGTGPDAAGIVVSGGLIRTEANIDAQTGANTITITESGTVSTAAGVDGTAILALDSWIAVTNEGTLVGSVRLLEGSDIVTTFADNSLGNTGFFASGAVVDVGAVLNAGTLSVGGDANVATTVFGGDFEQENAGVLAIDIDALGTQTADLVEVAGEADLGGTIETLSLNLLPGSYTVLTARDIVDEGFGVADTLLFDWSAQLTSTGLAISPAADFTPSGASLTTNESALAGYLQSTWDAGGSDTLAPLYGVLSDIGSSADYAAALDDIAGETLSVHASDQALATRIGLDGAFSCPVFVGEGTLLGETSCVWGKVEGGVTRRGSSAGSPGYSEDRLTFRVGGQGEVSSDWFVGGSASYSIVGADTGSLGAGSDGERVDASVAVKRVAGPWYLGLGANFGYGWYDNHRRVDIYGSGQRVTSDTDVFTAGGRLRIQYELPFADWYLRPRADIDLLYAHVPAYRENGPAGAALDVRAQDETTVAFAPYLEAGGRFGLGEAWVLRPYAGAGLVAMTNDTWVTKASLVGALSSAGTFEIKSDVPNLIGQFDLGLQLTRGNGFEARLEYGLELGDDYQSSTGSLRIGFEF
ncbi:autotransporter outer membrane beta-barrel domain-containing protein [Acuticoccus mangrovi]|uniref:Autotransporter domain-containing protein n=1 Tax=Acuticoccus mangrovi TaxID=2796142 RepID=A0A934IMX4_9HYPH|nr:autotransporter outer membrane beta-barrel domain-containing protein [Acuticoccus mangrovi]MBJ3775328.1 hypothetical protein [Acuticoccus mangrovi]